MCASTSVYCPLASLSTVKQSSDENITHDVYLLVGASCVIQMNCYTEMCLTHSVSGKCCACYILAGCCLSLQGALFSSGYTCIESPSPVSCSESMHRCTQSSSRAGQASRSHIMAVVCTTMYADLKDCKNNFSWLS